MLPKDFTDYTSTLFGKERWERYLASFEGNVPVSVRYNPFKKREDDESLAISEPLPWCRNAHDGLVEIVYQCSKQKKDSILRHE